MKVIIVGGSIAGLTLAHGLSRNNIDFIILEARDNIAPQVGAAIGIFAGGARILDQLGIWKDIEALIQPLMQSGLCKANGEIIREGNGIQLLAKRTGYPNAFLDRQVLLEILYRHISNKSKVLLSKRVSHIEKTDSEVIVHCTDGTSYSGDTVAGADGIHSIVRREMQRHIQLEQKADVESDDKNVSALYSCVFGICSEVPGLRNTSWRSYGQDFTVLTFCGKGGRHYWFLFTQLENRFHGSAIPKFRKEDTKEHIQKYMNTFVNDKVTFGMLWKTTESFSYVPLEEATFKTWTWDRFVCLGDSTHKMTPSSGEGGNAAIESAATLTNSLRRLNLSYGDMNPPLEHVKLALNEYFEERHLRANRICHAANTLTQLEALKTPIHKIVAYHLLPHIGDMHIDRICDSIIGAASLDGIPIPPPPHTPTLPFNPRLGIGKTESTALRAVYALPILVFFILAQWMPESDGWIPHRPENQYFAFLQSDRLASQAIETTLKLFILQVIWQIEGMRRANLMTLIQLPNVFLGFAYFYGFGKAVPVYFFMHYVQSPPLKYAAPDNRLTNVPRAKTLLVTLTLTYLVPALAMWSHLLPSSTRDTARIIWQLSPLTTSILHTGLASIIEDTTWHDRLFNPCSDMPFLRIAYVAGIFLASMEYLFELTPTIYGVFTITGTRIVPSVLNALKNEKGDYFYVFGAATVWILLSFKELKKVRVLCGWWGIILAFGLSRVLLGPWASIGVMWWWREELLTKVVPFDTYIK